MNVEYGSYLHCEVVIAVRAPGVCGPADVHIVIGVETDGGPHIPNIRTTVVPRQPQFGPVVIVLDGHAVDIEIRIHIPPRHQDVPGGIHFEVARYIVVNGWAIVTSLPLLDAVVVVLDRDPVLIRITPLAVSRDVDVPRRVETETPGLVEPRGITVIPCDPLLAAAAVVFDGGEIEVRSASLASAGDVDVARFVDLDVLGIVPRITGAVVAGGPLLGAG